MMADEPDNLIPVMLADIRTPDGRSRYFDESEMRPTDIEKRLDDGKNIIRYSPGQSSAAQLRQRRQESRNDEPLRKLERLLLDKMPV
jgi:hypothetical protein